MLPSPSDAPQGGAPTPGMSPMTRVPRPTGGEASPCMADFARLREDVDRQGMAAKAARQRHVGREEMCKYIAAFAAAQTRWVEFTEAGVQSCGIPVQILSQLKRLHASTEQTREKTCAFDPADVMWTSCTPLSDCSRLYSRSGAQMDERYHGPLRQE
jgi:hypothetical protein